MKRLAALAFATTLAGCAVVTNTVPDGYKGPIVTLVDTSVREDGSKGRFFAAMELDGNPINNALRETRRASSGAGFTLAMRIAIRDLPLKPMKIKLLGTHQTAAPIHEIASRMAGTFFSVEGVVDFSPIEGKRYEVTGELTKELSCVWIADIDTTQPVTSKVCTK